jgi:pimeloyl-ACP methyl ester carboxylesterase
VDRGDLSTYTAATSGVTLEYEVRGTGAPVLLIHCVLCAASFAPLMNEPALREYRLLRYHRRGYAGSSRAVAPVTIPDQAADVAGLAGHLGLGPMHVVGHSYGGLIALQFALDYPGLVGSMVLMEPALGVLSAGPAVQDLRWRIAQGFERYRRGDHAGAVDGFLGPIFGVGYRRVLDDVIPGGWQQVVRDADTFFGVEVPELKRWHFGEPEASRVRLPMLSLVGALSDRMFFEIEQLLAYWFPQLQTVRVPEVNHMLCLQRPDLVAAPLAQFFEQYPLS